MECDYDHYEHAGFGERGERQLVLYVAAYFEGMNNRRCK